MSKKGLILDDREANIPPDYKKEVKKEGEKVGGSGE